MHQIQTNSASDRAHDTSALAAELGKQANQRRQTMFCNERRLESGLGVHKSIHLVEQTEAHVVVGLLCWVDGMPVTIRGTIDNHSTETELRENRMQKRMSAEAT